MLGRVETPNEVLDDLVLVRSDGRPTYNFASPVEDWLDGITHVIRGRDHVSNTPKQINILRALGADIPVYAHMPDVAGDDGKKLSKRHGAQSLDEFRDMGYYAPALMNFLALLGWSYDDKTTIMSRDELIERFSFDRVQPSPATFDYKKLDWMNGVYLRALPPDEYADALIEYLGPELGPGEGAEDRAARAGEARALRRVSALRELLLQRRRRAGGPVAARPARPLTAREAVLRELDDVGRRNDRGRACAGSPTSSALKPGQAFQPIRMAVTGSKISPGLFESLELLGRDESLRRLSRAVGAAA